MAEKKPSQAEMDRKWRAECDLNALVAAREVKNDSARMKAAQQVAQEKVTAAKAAASAVGRSKTNGKPAKGK
jgi:hypothetical protein